MEDLLIYYVTRYIFRFIKSFIIKISCIYIFKKLNFYKYIKIYLNQRMLLEISKNHYTFDDDTSSDYNDLYGSDEKTYEEIKKMIKDNIVFITDGCKEKLIWKTVKDNEVSCSVTRSIPRILGEIEVNEENKKSNLNKIIKKNIKNILLHNYDFIPFNPENIPSFTEPTFNTFRGFNVKYEKKFKVDMKVIEPITNHIKVLANYEDKSYEYILNYMSRIVKEPNKKTGVCMVFMSDQGAGKTTFWEWFNREIIGKEWTLTLSNNENIFRNFNAEMQNKLVTILDEAQLDGSYKKKSDQLKSLITQNYIRIEYKGLDPVTMNDRNNYIILTNNDFPVKVEQSDRRFAIFKMSNDKCGNNDYFDKLNESFKDDNVKKHFFHYLLQNDISKFIPERDIPITEAKMELKKESCPTPIKFALDLYKNGIKMPFDRDYLDDDNFSTLTPNKVDTSNLYRCYKDFVLKKCPNDKSYAESGFINQFNKLLNIKTKTKKGEKTTTITKEILKESLCKYFKVKDLSEIYVEEIEYDSGVSSDEENEKNQKEGKPKCKHCDIEFYMDESYTLACGCTAKANDELAYKEDTNKEEYNKFNKFVKPPTIY